jgi:hypothetical protein
MKIEWQILLSVRIQFLKFFISGLTSKDQCPRQSQQGLHRSILNPFNSLDHNLVEFLWS